MRFFPYTAESGGGAGKADRRRAIKKLRTLVLSPKLEPEAIKERVEQEFSSPYLPARVDCREKSFGGITCDVLSPEVMASNRLIIYIHGGGFVAGSRASWRSFCASFAAEASTQLILPEYRLSPQFPYPAALEDLQMVFGKIHERILTAGQEMPHIILAADGSGASLLLALVQNLKEELRQTIRSAILISPWLDLNPDSEFLADKRLTDGILSAEAITSCARLYTSEENLKNPLISPLYIAKNNLENFPSIYIQCGGDEPTVEGIRHFHKKLEESGIPCTLDMWPGMMFMFQMAHEYLPQAHLAVQRVGSYIQNFNKTEETE